MSASNAAARKRRAPQSEAPLPVPAPVNTRQQPQINSTTNNLTLPQVISILDNRLIKVESFMKENQSLVNQSSINTNSTKLETETQQEQKQDSTNIWIDEFNNRFELLAEEIGSLKDIVLKLQSYTMDVNKTLMEERINVFSDLTNVNNVSENIVLEHSNESNNTDIIISSVNLQTLASQELSSI